jgi:hypothetical protein
MIIKTINVEQAREAMGQWKLNDYDDRFVVNLDDDYKKIRDNLIECYSKFEDSNSEELNSSKSNYFIDVYMGLCLYTTLWSFEGFSMRAASDDGFWRYFAVDVIPDIIAKRWGYDSDAHYWARASRIWPRQIWWYIHLSWQGDIKRTEKILKSSNFTTDTILNLEERTGREGTFIDVYRWIMYFYSMIPSDKLEQYNAELKKKNKNNYLFRTIMKLNTAESVAVEPTLYPGGAKEFARKLFLDVGVEF